MKYCFVEKPKMQSLGVTANRFNERGIIAEKLGDKILKAIEFGADLGSPAQIKFDDKGQDGVDVMTSPNHDFFDIAENFGEQIAQSVGPVPSAVDSGATEGAIAPMADEPVTE